MKLEIQFKEYIEALKPCSNQPLSLETVLKPFGIASPFNLSDDLLVGHLIDHMEDEWSQEDYIDAIDVSVAAMELGHREAERFLDDAPVIMAQMVRSFAS